MSRCLFIGVLLQAWALAGVRVTPGPVTVAPTANVPDVTAVTLSVAVTPSKLAVPVNPPMPVAAKLTPNTI